MKTCLFLAWFSCIITVPCYCQDEIMEHWKELHAQSKRLCREGKYKEGIRLEQKALQLARQYFGEKHPHTLGCPEQSGNSIQ